MWLPLKINDIYINSERKDLNGTSFIQFLQFQQHQFFKKDPAASLDSKQRWIWGGARHPKKIIRNNPILLVLHEDNCATTQVCTLGVRILDPSQAQVPSGSERVHHDQELLWPTVSASFSFSFHYTGLAVLGQLT